MSDSRSCGRCIYYNSITNECGEESKCMRDVDEAKYTSYIAGKKQGKLDGAKEFAEWLSHQDKVFYDTVSKDFYTCDGEHYIISTLSIDGIIAEWQKEVGNE